MHYASFDLHSARQQRLLCIAAEHGSLRGVKAALAAGAELNLLDPKFGWPPLHYAIRWEQAALVLTMLDLGADPNLQSASLECALYIAIMRRQHAIARQLLFAGADVRLGHTLADQPPLIEAARIGSVALTNLLLKFGADPNLGNKYGDYPLYEAIRAKHHAVAKLLRQSGATAETSKPRPIKASKWNILDGSTGVVKLPPPDNLAVGEVTEPSGDDLCILIEDCVSNDYGETYFAYMCDGKKVCFFDAKGSVLQASEVENPRPSVGMYKDVRRFFSQYEAVVVSPPTAAYDEPAIDDYSQPLQGNVFVT